MGFSQTKCITLSSKNVNKLKRKFVFVIFQTRVEQPFQTISLQYNNHSSVALCTKSAALQHASKCSKKISATKTQTNIWSF